MKTLSFRTIALLCLAPVFWPASTAAVEQWLTIAGDFAHSGLADRGPADFTRDTGPIGADQDLLQGSSPAVWNNVVVTLAEIYDGAVPVSQAVVAYDRNTWTQLWKTPIELPPFTNNNPTIDATRQAVLVAAGYTLYSLDLADGAVNWDTPLTNLTNASFTVMGDLGYVADFDGFGTGASLFAINLDPDHAVHEAGDIVWQSPIGGASGATPAVGEDRIYVGSNEGRVLAFDPATGVELWSEEMPAVPQPGGGNGWGMATVTYHNGAVYAASYNWESTIGEYNSHLVKLDAATGTRLWDTPCERSYSPPVVVGDLIYLTGGIGGGYGGISFGSVPKLMCFRDLGTGAQLEWDTELVGGSTYNLVYAAGKLYAGLARDFPEDYVYDRMYIFDAAKTPDAPGFILDQVNGPGAGPALVDGTLYTIGVGGLYVFDSPPVTPGDIDLNGGVNLNDFATFATCFPGCDPANPPPDCSETEFQRCDMTGDGCVNLHDFATFALNFSG